ncbi:MAG: Brp/Blh family beta-carotene 15,15'-dioxygenase [Gloeobacteraceae cyanobacterium ES-bin-316]|nr:Brp/Blh family beta-carotene 15,15'-dioxygenase [Ferruginibacter sp.]
MIRFVMLIAGFLLLLIQHFIAPISTQLQFIIFLTGIILLGIPHGAADLLVATRNAADEKKIFSKIKFFVHYLGRLFLFDAIIWFFPLLGNILFIFFAAYHFGETDLHQFNTNSFIGKLFVISYGLLILGVILLNHFEEMMPLFQLFDSGVQNAAFLSWLGESRYSLLTIITVFFFATAFLYFATAKTIQPKQGLFLIQFTLILCILYHLPMMLGFSFYFIVWHSILSLKNIIGYLGRDGKYKSGVIAKQIGFYSILAMVGMSIFGLTGFMFVNNDTMIVYVFLGLAVLTAPHMQIMHDMYKSLRA